MEKKRLDSAGAAAKPKGKRKAGGDRDKERDATAKKRKEGKETQKQQFDVFDDQVRKNMMVPLNLGGGVVYHLQKKHQLVTEERWTALMAANPNSVDKQTYIRALASNSIASAIQGPLVVQRFVPLKTTPLTGALESDEMRNALCKLRLLGTSRWAAARFGIEKETKMVPARDLSQISLLDEFMGQANGKLKRFETRASGGSEVAATLAAAAAVAPDSAAAAAVVTEVAAAIATTEATGAGAAAEDKKKTEKKSYQESDTIVTVQDAQGRDFPMTIHTWSELFNDGFYEIKEGKMCLTSPKNMGWTIWTEHQQSFLLPLAWMSESVRKQFAPNNLADALVNQTFIASPSQEPLKPTYQTLAALDLLIPSEPVSADHKLELSGDHAAAAAQAKLAREQQQREAASEKAYSAFNTN